jgi:hypothetical protein
MPVSRAWGVSASPHGPDSLDFSYCIYDWDNSFATLLMASGSDSSNHSSSSSSSSSSSGSSSGSRSSSSSASSIGNLGGATPTTTTTVKEDAQPDDLRDGFGLAMSNLIQTVKVRNTALLVSTSLVLRNSPAI